MEYRPFGNTGITVSEVGVGCARLGGVFQHVNRTDMIEILRTAFEAGINFYDTSDMYTQGESEKVIGEAFRANRAEVFIASKAGYVLPRQRTVASRLKPLLRPLVQRVRIKRESIPSRLRGSLSQNFSPEYLCSAAERTLNRLRTDYLDLFQLHSPPTSVLEQGDFLAPLEKLQREGKIRYFGVSCERTEDGLICLRYPGISSLQVRLNLLDQSALSDLVPRAHTQGVAIIARECFAGGLLAKPKDQFECDETTALTSEMSAERIELAEVRQAARSCQRSIPDLALQFVRGVDGVTVSLLGLRTMEHLTGNLRLLAMPPLSKAERSALLRLTESHDSRANPTL